MISRIVFSLALSVRAMAPGREGIGLGLAGVPSLAVMEPPVRASTNAFTPRRGNTGALPLAGLESIFIGCGIRQPLGCLGSALLGALVQLDRLPQGFARLVVGKSPALHLAPVGQHGCRDRAEREKCHGAGFESVAP